jgi:hypothetical protein
VKIGASLYTCDGRGIKHPHTPNKFVFMSFFSLFIEEEEEKEGTQGREEWRW